MDQLSLLKAKLIDHLHDYPHVQERIIRFWGDKIGRNYLKELTIPERIGRAGFTMEAIRAINELIELHDLEHPAYRPIMDPWDQSFGR
jgi:hypothetical protein